MWSRRRSQICTVERVWGSYRYWEIVIVTRHIRVATPAAQMSRCIAEQLDCIVQVRPEVLGMYISRSWFVILREVLGKGGIVVGNPFLGSMNEYEGIVRKGVMIFLVLWWCHSMVSTITFRWRRRWVKWWQVLKAEHQPRPYCGCWLSYPRPRQEYLRLGSFLPPCCFLHIYLLIMK